MSCYSVFTFEPLHILVLRTSKLVKQCTGNYFSSERLRTGGVQRGEKSFDKIRLRVLCGCHLLINANESDGELPGTRKDFSKEVH